MNDFSLGALQKRFKSNSDNNENNDEIQEKNYLFHGNVISNEKNFKDLYREFYIDQCNPSFGQYFYAVLVASVKSLLLVALCFAISLAVVVLGAPLLPVIAVAGVVSIGAVYSKSKDY